MTDNNEFQRFTARLQQAASVWRQELAACLLLRSLAALTLAWLVFFILDAVWHLSSWARVSLTGLWLLATAVIVLLALQRLWAAKIPPERVARRLEARQPSLGSKLINALQLHRSAEAYDSVTTRQFAQQAVARSLEDAEVQEADFSQLARSPEPARLLRRAALHVAVVVVVMIAIFPVTWAGLQRFALPFSDVPPFSFTRLAIVEPDVDGTTVVYGEPLTITATSKGHRPSEVILHYQPRAGGPIAEASMFDKGKELGYVQRIERVTDGLLLWVETPNGRAVSPRREVLVQRTPKWEGGEVIVTPPAYTKLAPRQTDYRFQDLRILRGSTLTFTARSNRPLAGGVLRQVKDGEVVGTHSFQPAEENAVELSFQPSESSLLLFELEDVDGLRSKEELKGSLALLEDLGPRATVEPGVDTFVALSHPLEVTARGSDDYGITQLRVHRGINGIYGPPRVVSFAETPNRAKETLSFRFDKLGAQPGDVVAVFAEAIDSAPEPRIGRSKTVRFTLISDEQYNEMLRRERDMRDVEERYTALLDERQLLAERQRALQEELESLKQELAKVDSPEAREALEKKLAELAAEQKSIREETEALAKKLENFVRETPLYDIEREFGERLQQEAQRLREAAQANAAAQAPPQGSAGAQATQMQQAGQQLQNALEPGADESGDDLAETAATLADLADLHEIMKNMQMFELLYQEQQAITEQLSPYQNRHDLSRADQLAMRDLAERQQSVGAHLQALERKLREDAARARENFPKAAESAEGLAEGIDQARLEPMAQSAAQSMLGAEGPGAWRKAERLRQTMEAFCQECQSQQGQMAGEMDRYLGPQMQSGQTFAQMLQSRRFRMGSLGQAAQGQGGLDGYSMAAEPFDVLGGEGSLLAGRAGESNRSANAENSPEPEPTAELDDTDQLDRVTAEQRASEAIRREVALEEYRELIEEYFQSITRRQPSKEEEP